MNNILNMLQMLYKNKTPRLQLDGNGLKAFSQDEEEDEDMHCRYFCFTKHLKFLIEKLGEKKKKQGIIEICNLLFA